MILFRYLPVFVVAFAVSFASAERVDFKKQVLPILQEHCFHCHAEDEQESGLRLDLRPRMLRGGDSGLAAVVPSKPDKSYLIEVINHVDEDMAMPPDEDKIPKEQIDLLTRWIAEGAVWPGQMDLVDERKTDHWAFQPVTRPAIPKSKNDSYSAIDRFLDRKLVENELSFSAAASPRSLIRRASIVLTGLAPTTAELDEFLASYEDDPDRAYEALVDRLMQSPHFGERWAQHWLDVIRWAETNGSESNLYRKNAWIYRDYVARSFNEDKPYDQFVREQIAGDTMGSGEATGFLVAGPHVPAATVGREPTAIRQARADRMDEIMQTVGASMLGITVGCARCHNHKFDPFTITDYYAMTGVFADIEFGGRFPEFAADHPRRQRGEEIWKQIAAERKRLRKIGPWEENWGAYREMHFKPVSTKAIRIRFKAANVSLDELQVYGDAERNRNLALASNGAKLTAFPMQGADNRNPAERLNDGEFGTMVWRAKFDSKSKERAWIEVVFAEEATINRVQMSNNREYFYETDYLDKKPSLPRYEYDLDVMDSNGEWKPWVGTWFANKKLDQQNPERKKVLQQVQKHIETLAEQAPRPSFVGRFVPPAKTYVLHRGSPESPRDEVAPAGPAIFAGDLGLTSMAKGSLRRAKFADWIVDSENPLTARVITNRLWHHVFGQGIVPTTSDFGEAGARASHPQLLDWLASELGDPAVDAHAKPWSMKRMIRMMVMSRAFRQSSAPTSVGMKSDAASTLLWRFPPKRVDAEVIRDNILLASGKLDRTIGGRSFRIHNVKKTYAQWEVVDNHGPETWRRMLYQERMRRVDDRMFTAFDFPDCGQVRAKRPVSTTPLQALNLLNSDFVLQQSDLIAQRAKTIGESDPAKTVEACFQLLLGRPPTDAERSACLAMATEHGMNVVCRALINSNEFAFLP